MEPPKSRVGDEEILDALAAQEQDSSIRVGFKDSEVVIQFGSSFYVGLPPAEAKGLAKLLLKYANPVTRPKGKG